MTPYYDSRGVTIFHGDCLDVMRDREPNSIDAIITDPPYGIRFMGKAWDGADIEAMVNDREKYSTDPDPRAGVRGGHRSRAAQAGKYNRSLSANQAFQIWSQTWAIEALRVAKPGAHLVAFGGPRTYHRLASAIEDAGWEIRDCIMWIFGSGFPKSLDVGKAIDKAAGAERVQTGKVKCVTGNQSHGSAAMHDNTGLGKSNAGPQIAMETLPVTDDAKHWAGWGTALKPAYEPILIARKPLDGTVAQNVLKWGTGAMNIDGCRIGGKWTGSASRQNQDMTGGSYAGGHGKKDGPMTHQHALGRWPANLIHDGSEEVIEAFPVAPGQIADAKIDPSGRKTQNIYGAMKRGHEASANNDNAGGVGFKMKPGARRLDAGSSARFFYTAKASPLDRGHEEWDSLPLFGDLAGEFKNIHPTVKPLALMRYLIQLVSREGHVILDPFAGSGTTLLAAQDLGREAIGIEQEHEYCQIAKRRLGSART